MKHIPFSHLSLLFLITCISIILSGRVPYEASFTSSMDLHFYRQIALAAPNISTDLPQPFIYRFAGPYLIGILPLPHEVGFYIFSVLSSITLAFSLYLFLISQNISSTTAIITVTLFVFNKYTFMFTIWNYFQINDVIAHISLILLIMALQKEKWIIVSIILFFSMLARETSLIIIPVAIIYTIEQHRFRQNLKNIIIMSVPALSYFLGIRLILTPNGGDGLISAFLNYSQQLFTFESWFRLIINTYIPIILIPLIFLNQTITFFRKRLYLVTLVVCTFISTLFGIDHERLMTPSFIAFYWLMAVLIQDHLQRDNKMMILLIGGTIMASFNPLIGAYTIPLLPTVIISGFVTVLITFAAYTTKKRSTKQKYIST